MRQSIEFKTTNSGKEPDGSNTLNLTQCMPLLICLLLALQLIPSSIKINNSFKQTNNGYKIIKAFKLFGFKAKKTQQTAQMARQGNATNAP